MESLFGLSLGLGLSMYVSIWLNIIGSWEKLTFFAAPLTVFLVSFLALVTFAPATFLIFGLVSFFGAAAFLGLATAFLGAAFFFGSAAAAGVGSTFLGRDPVVCRVCF